jgi:hypothetical protein
LAGIGSEERRARIRGCLTRLPPGFVDIASPFARLFHFRALLELEDPEAERFVFASIRRIWGEMLRRDATTCWEGWSFIPGHYTRSHCHAWSAGPAYLFGAHLLGVRPLEPGFATASVQPHFDTLEWMDGAVPTPHGLIEVHAQGIDGKWRLDISAPREVKIIFRCPKGYTTEAGGDTMQVNSRNRMRVLLVESTKRGMW